MKKVLLIVLVVIMLSLASCGSPKPSQEYKALSEYTMPELESMLDKTWLSASHGLTVLQQQARLQKCIVIELELLRRK